jgi:F5/8 type C domain
MQRIRHAAAIVASFAALAIASTYPLIGRITNHIASDLGDPLLVAWMLAWDADRLRHGLVGVWDAPNFFPYRHTLLYSEHFLGVAIFTAPLQWLTGNAILTYNLAFLGSFVVAGCGMYALARRLTGRSDAAFIAGLIFAFYPFRASHSSHLQLLMIGWLPLSVWALHRYFDTGRLRDLLLSTGFYLLQTLTVGYFAYYGLLPLSFVAFWELLRRRPATRQLLLHGAAAAALAGTVMLPVVAAYAQVRRDSGLRRSVDEIKSQSADVGDYVSASPSLRLWGGMGSGRGEHELFPGVTAVALAAWSLAFRRRSRAIGLYASLFAAAFILSLGPEPRVFGHSIGMPGPYAALLRVVPGLDGLRVPARLAIVCQMALAVLAAFGAADLIDRFGSASARQGIRRAIVTTILGALIAAEGWPRLGAPPFDAQGDARDRAGYAYLASLPQGGAIELPTAAERLLDEFVYQYMTLVHHHPIVNGHSGYVSPLAVWLRGGHSPLRESGRQEDAIDMLRSIGVRYVVVHRDAYDDAGLRDEVLRALSNDRRAIAQQTFERMTVAVLAPADPPPPVNGAAVPRESITAQASDEGDRLPFLFDGDRDSRWLTARPQRGDEWLTLAFDRPREVAGVRLQLGARSFGDYPRALRIESADDGDWRTLFEGSVLPHLARGIMKDGEYPFIEIPLPPNRTKALRLSQRGRANTFFWSIHELEVVERPFDSR